MTKIITSPKNSDIRKLLAYKSSRKRIKDNIFYVEGEREITKAIHNGYVAKEVYFCSELFSEKTKKLLSHNKLNSVPHVKVSSQVFEQIAMREKTDGLYVLFKRKNCNLQQVKLSKHYNLIIIIDQIEKPGNIGAILRTADATHATAVFITSNTDIYHPNIIRSSLGCLFTVPTFSCTPKESFDFCQKNNIRTLASTISDQATPYHQQDFRQSLALVVGNEAVGISGFWNTRAKQHIMIPMLGQVDSLNVSVATGILLYEIVRQRLSC